MKCASQGLRLGPIRPPTDEIGQRGPNEFGGPFRAWGHQLLTCGKKRCERLVSDGAKRVAEWQRRAGEEAKAGARSNEKPSRRAKGWGSLDGG